jgi:hypothetical protein
MTISIGPNFANEVTAAGLLGLPFSWGPDGIAIADARLTATQKTAIAAVVAAHDPTKPDPRATLAAKLAAGCQITSTANPGTLSGSYPLDDESLLKIAGVATRVSLGKGLPLGAATVQVPDTIGAVHAFGATDLVNLGDALSDYIAGLQATAETLLAGGTANWPSATATIA